MPKKSSLLNMDLNETMTLSVYQLFKLWNDCCQSFAHEVEKEFNIPEVKVPIGPLLEQFLNCLKSINETS